MCINRKLLALLFKLRWADRFVQSTQKTRSYQPGDSDEHEDLWPNDDYCYSSPPPQRDVKHVVLPAAALAAPHRTWAVSAVMMGSGLSTVWRLENNEKLLKQYRRTNPWGFFFSSYDIEDADCWVTTAVQVQFTDSTIILYLPCVLSRHRRVLVSMQSLLLFLLL